MPSELENSIFWAIFNTFPRPKNVRQVRQFLGLCAFYRKFQASFGETVKCLCSLTSPKVPFEWTEECEAAFLKLRSALTSDSILALPDFTKEFVLTTDASQTGLAAFAGHASKRPLQ